MVDSATRAYWFPALAGMPLEAAFEAGRLTSDGGLPWLAQADQALGLCAALAACVPDWRRGPVRHALETLVRQRVYQIACGYEDRNDATTLRSDPLLELVCGRLPLSGADLASQPTLSRLEQVADRHLVEAMAEALVALYVHERGRSGGSAPRRLGLGWDRRPGPWPPTPRWAITASTASSSPPCCDRATCTAAASWVPVLRRPLERLRAAWPDVQVEIRADSGSAVPRLDAWCEQQQVTYTIGLIADPRLEAIAAPLLAEARAQSAAQGGATVRLVGETVYQAGTWPAERRVIFTAEALAKGPKTRFVVTTRTDAPMTVYDWYVDRGEPENWSKDFKNALQADHLHDHRFWSNAFRLLLHAAASWLLDTLRRWLAATVPQDAAIQLDTLRRRLPKIGGRVRELPARIRLHLASSHPSEPLRAALAAHPVRS
jgi:Transposase DDE domain group 1